MDIRASLFANPYGPFFFTIQGLSVVYSGSENFSGDETITSAVVSDDVSDLSAKVDAGLKIGVFYNCLNLESVELPTSLRTIGIKAFSGCKLLECLIPSGVVELGDHCFSGCRLLNTVDLPPGLKTIGYCAFSNCKSLENVNFHELKVLRSLGARAFFGCSALTRIELKSQLLKAIETHAFDGCEGLKKLYLPSSVEAIESDAFLNCRSLSVVVPYNVKREVHESLKRAQVVVVDRPRWPQWKSELGAIFYKDEAIKVGLVVGEDLSTNEFDDNMRERGAFEG